MVVYSTFRTYTADPRDPGPIWDNLAVVDYVTSMPEVDPVSVEFTAMCIGLIK